MERSGVGSAKWRWVVQSGVGGVKWRWVTQSGGGWQWGWVACGGRCEVEVGSVKCRVEHGYSENCSMYATVLQVQVAVCGSQTCEHTAPVAAVSQVCDRLFCLLAVPHAMPGHPRLHTTILKMWYSRRWGNLGPDTFHRALACRWIWGNVQQTGSCQKTK